MSADFVVCHLREFKVLVDSFAAKPEASPLTDPIRAGVFLGPWATVEDWANDFSTFLVRLWEFAARGRRQLIGVEEEFGAVADGIAEFQLHAAESFHRLAIDMGLFHIRAVLFVVGFGNDEEGDHCYTALCEGFSPENIAPYVATFAKHGLEKLAKLGITYDDERWFRVRLRQELFRAWKRKYPDNSMTYETYTPNGQAEVGAFLEDPTLGAGERRIITVIHGAGHRLTTDAIMQKLETCYGPTSLGTTKMYLASLVRRQRLTNRQDVTPKGYGLPEWK